MPSRTGRLGPPALAPELRRTLSWVSVGAALVVVVLGTVLAGTSTPSRLDELILETVSRLAPAGEWAYRVDWGGETAGVVTVAVVLVAVCLCLGRWRLAVLTVAGQALLGGVDELLKITVDRTIHGEFLSYPSGHAAGATGFALVVALLVTDVVRAGRGIRVLVLIGIPLIVGVVASSAQIVIMAHYPTDTIAGFCLAVALVPPLASVIDWTAGRIAGPELS